MSSSLSKKLLNALFTPYEIPDCFFASCFVTNFEQRTGTSAIATMSDDMSEKIIVHEMSLNICPISPSLLLKTSIGRKMQTDVSVEPVIEETISCEPRTAATRGFVSRSMYE